MADLHWFVRDGGKVTIAVHAQPGASQTQIQGLHGDALKIRVAAPPVEGRANEALIAFLAKMFHVSRQQIRLVGGTTSRQKRFCITGCAMADEKIEAMANLQAKQASLF